MSATVPPVHVRFASVNVPHVRISKTHAPKHRKKSLPLRASASTTRTLSVPENLACGAIGRTAQIVSTFPIDTIKTRVQVSGISVSSSSVAVSPLSRIASAITRGHLYRGASVSLMGQVPYGMLTFGIYETLKTFVAESEFSTLPEWTKTALCATIGDAIGSLWLTPSEVVKSKTQAGVFASPMQAISHISKQGPLGFYQGYSAAIARDIPFRIIQLLMFERSRAWYMERTNKTIDQITPIENLFIGAFAGTITGATTCPLDVIRTRMMSQPKGTYKNVIDCVAKLLAKDGPGALIRGIIPRCFVIGPSSAIFFFTFEAAKAFFRARKPPSSALRRASTSGICSRRPQVSLC
ncbi:mitochondrial carrier (BOU / S-adenosylmethionine carrier) [Gracilaria domingensis]|nr:mitochondrial carrier (BOU / S-adenosylmethionine carrier) [Gracilaria domingensis]